MDKLNFETKDGIENNVERIAEIFPSAVTEGKINFDTLRTLLGDEVAGDERYEFTWVGKKEAMREAGRPIRKTLRPCPEESKNWEETENLYIEGDNLEVLKLLQESYLGKIKMIYIDPPYNTGDDFLYPDNFSQTVRQYNETSSVLNERGDKLVVNSNSDGRFHSRWCSMIYPRLILGHSLLAQNGLCLISIDEHEHASLRKICDEIFGESNYIGDLTWEATTQPNNSGNAKFGLQKKTEPILMYAKNKNSLSGFNLEINEERKKKYPHEGAFGPCRFEIIEKSDAGTYSRPSMKFKILGQYPREGKRWQIGEDKARELESTGRVQIVDGIVKKAVYPEDEEDNVSYLPFWSLLSAKDVGTAQTGKEELRTIFQSDLGFDTVKPVQLIKSIISKMNEHNVLILDFFSGSSTTAHAVIQKNAEDNGNRKFILVQIPEETSLDSDAYRAGYANIADLGKERIRRAGEKIKTEINEENKQVKIGEDPKPIPDIGFRVFKVDDSNMKNVYYSAEEYHQLELDQLVSNIKKDRTDVDLLFACLLDWGLPLSMPHSQEEIDGVRVHTYNNGDLIACFADNISEELVRTIASRRPLRVVFRDSSFADSPSKINVEEIFKLLAPNTSIRVL